MAFDMLFVNTLGLWLHGDFKHCQEGDRSYAQGTLCDAYCCSSVHDTRNIYIRIEKPLTYIAALVYIAGEHRNRGHSWEEFGIKLRGFKKDLQANGYLILIVVLALQLPIPLIARTYWPDLL
jgi:hypothetical protein